MIEPAHKVRVASFADRDKIIALCRLCHSEVGLFSLSDAKMIGVVDYLLAGGDGVIGVIGDKEIEGSVCLRLASPAYSDDVYLEEVWNFVHPNFRAPGRAKYLIRYAKGCAERLSLPFFAMLTLSDKTEAKFRLYERELERSGGCFMHRPSVAQVNAA